jgi:acyl-CoA synthetase (AMP-forming)/AMP-acid ligase II
MEFNLADLFEAVADAVPDRTAVIAGDRRLTYRELDERANRVAHYLRDVGVLPGQHVGIYSFNRVEWVETMLGCFKARAVPINVNYRYVIEELRYLFDNADLVALFFESEFGPHVGAVLSASRICSTSSDSTTGPAPTTPSTRSTTKTRWRSPTPPAPACSPARPTICTSCTRAGPPACRKA